MLGLVRNHPNFATVADISPPPDAHSRLTQAPHSDQSRAICHCPEPRYYELTFCDTAVGGSISEIAEGWPRTRWCSGRSLGLAVRASFRMPCVIAE